MEQKEKFEDLGQQEQNISLVAEFFAFLKNNKKLWLLPVVLLLFLLGLLVVLGGSSVAPFIYTLF